MSLGKPARDFDCLRDAALWYRPHRDDQRTVKTPGWATPAVGPIHRDVGSRLPVAHGDASTLQLALEAEAAPEQEGHQFFAPPLGNRGRFGDDLATFVDAIAWQIEAQIGCRCGL